MGTSPVEQKRRSEAADRILDRITPILNYYTTGIAERDRESMAVLIIGEIDKIEQAATLAADQEWREKLARETPITLTAAEAAQRIITKIIGTSPLTPRGEMIKAEIVQMIATIQAEARAEGAMVKLYDYAQADPPIDPIAWQAAADRLMQWADHPGAKELAERTQAAQALEQTGPAGGKLHIHMTVDDLTPTIQRIIDSAMAELAKRLEAGA